MNKKLIVALMAIALVVCLLPSVVLADSECTFGQHDQMWALGMKCPICNEWPPVAEPEAQHEGCYDPANCDGVALLEVVTKEATCKVAGEKEVTYPCGKLAWETIPVNDDHNYVLGVVKKEGTCKVAGLEEWFCTVCGDVEYYEPMGEHNYVLGVVKKEGTCKVAGLEEWFCTICGDVEYYEPMGEHNYVLGVVKKEATCKKTGLEEWFCTICGDVEYIETPKTDDHNYILGVVKKEATCEQDGLGEYFCTVCGDVEYWTIEGGHDWQLHLGIAPTCNAEGNIAYEQCTVCGAAQTIGENPMPLSKNGWILGPTGEHEMEAYDAVAATCDTDGHYAFEYCTKCECFFYEDPMMLTYQAGVIPALGHDWVEYEAVEPTCDTEGNIAYKQCSVCGAAETAGENPIPLGRYGWIEAATGHTWVEYEAVAPTCDTEGNIAYKQCSVCGAAETAGENPMPLGRYGWVLGATGHEWKAYEAVEPTCDTDGNIAYEQCTVCGAAQTAGENPMPLGRFGWVLGATGHDWEAHEAVEPTCDTDGNIAYEQCKVCGAAQTAGENPMPLGRFGWVLGATGHDWEAHEAVAPTCNAEGNIAYEQCKVCGAAQTAGENPLPLGRYQWVLGPTGDHKMEHYDAVAPTCDQAGHEAFDFCTVCECFFYEDALKLSFQDGIIPELGHKWEAHEAVAPSCNAEGNIAYEQCTVCGAARTVGENPVPLAKNGWVLGPTGEHTMEKHDAIEATCDTDGHEAFEYCTTCECFFYADPLKLTYQAGVIPALGHKWVEYEAVAPTCFEPGNIAYKQCEVCGAAQTAGENPIPLGKDSWILGVEHKIAHVEAKAPTTEAEGNQEYWYCTECGYAWADAELTLVTNLKNVIIPAIETPNTGDSTPVVLIAVVMVMAVVAMAVVVVMKKRYVTK